MTSLLHPFNVSTDASGSTCCRLRPDGPSQLCESQYIRMVCLSRIVENDENDDNDENPDALTRVSTLTAAT
ncbi:MAG: hypothetical protein K2K23_11550 [Muribaculaceae bacterium]|nr:hypothetical protein [Muribaculaceae bacterium]